MDKSPMQVKLDGITPEDVCQAAMRKSFLDVIAAAGGVPNLENWINMPLHEVIEKLAPNGVRFCYVEKALEIAGDNLAHAGRILRNSP